MSDLFAKEGVWVHVFTAFIFPSETIRRNYFKFRLGCIIISLHFSILFLSRVCHTCTLQSVRHAVAMQWPSVLLYGFDP